MKKVLVSSCLLGKPVRYDGRGMASDNPILAKWLDEGRVVSFCPEVSGGLPTPWPAAEIQGDGGAAVLVGVAVVVDNTGIDVSKEFILGAESALELCQAEGIMLAIMSESSPSCGSTTIYDGGFTRSKILGQGVTAALLTQNGIKVFSQHSMESAEVFLNSLAEH